MSNLVDQSNREPTRKVAAGGIAGAVVTVFAWLTGIELPTEVAAALLTIVYFAAAYFTKERK